MLPWGEMLRAGLLLGIGPEAFWRLSLKEWRWLCEQGGGLGRGGLMRLMQDHPDTAENGSKE